MPDDPKPKPEPAPPPKPSKPADPSVYGGQWGEGDKTKLPGTPPTDRPDKIEKPAEAPAPQGAEPPPTTQASAS